MQICDRCHSAGDYKLGVKTLSSNTHESWDLCVSCFDATLEFINKKQADPIPSKRTTAKRRSKK